MKRNLFNRKSVALAAALLLPAGAALAANGEALPAELPSMATPASSNLLEPTPRVIAHTVAAPNEGQGEALPPEAELLNRLQTVVPPSQGSSLSRAEVREQLMQARKDGTLGEGGEIGDSERVLAARERSNAEMAQRIEAQYAAAALAQATEQPTYQTYVTNFGNERRTEVVMVLPDGRQETVSVEWYTLDEQGQPVQSSSADGGLKPVSTIGLAEQARVADFAIITVPPATDAATVEQMRQAWELHGLPVKRMYVEGGSNAPAAV